MRRYLSPGWLLGHTVALVLFLTCLALGWWQVTRAGEGNLSSYAYAVEWPIFAGFVGYVWYREVRRAGSSDAATTGQPDAANPTADGTGAGDPGPGAPGPGGATRVGASASPTDTAPPAGAGARTAGSPARRPHDEADDEVTEYNRMLAWLNANPHRRMSDYPG